MSNSIEDVFQRYEASLLQKKNVVSVGIGEDKGDRFIIVFVREKIPKEELHPDDVIPQVLDGYRVDVREQLLIG